MKKILSIALLWFSVFTFAVAPAFAQEGKTDPQKSFREAVREAELVTTKDAKDFPSLASAVGSVLNILLTFIGTLVLLIVIYAGFTWATAAGNEEKIKKAKGMLVGGVIGLVIITTSAYLIGFVVEVLDKAI